MTQFARPFADSTNSNWGPSPLYPHVNTTSFNDGSPVKCPVPPGGSFDVLLSPLAWPAPGPESQTLTVRFNEALPGDALVTFFLFQAIPGGLIVVAAASAQPTAAFISYDLSLTASEVALITDYTNLRVRVVAGGPGTGSYYGSGSGIPVGGGVIVPCCPGPLPLTLHITFTGALAPMGTVVLTFDGATAWGAAVLGACGIVRDQVTFGCDDISGTFFLRLGTAISASATSVNCSPLEITFGGNNTVGTCSGSWGARVTP